MLTTDVRLAALALVALGEVVIVQSAAAQADLVPPRITFVVPAPAAGVNDQVGLQHVSVTFDEPVTVPTNAITVWSVNAGPINDYDVSYDDRSNQLVIAFDSPLASDRVTVVLRSTIEDTAGNRLDGEIAAPAAPLLPSGDGVEGGPAVFRFNVLKGDVNGDGLVDGTDTIELVQALGQCVGDAGYVPGADLNLDGCINVLDVQILTSGTGGSLPPLDGSVPTIVASNPPAGPLPSSVGSFVVTFSEPIEPASFVTDAAQLRNLTGAVLFPSSAVLAGNGLSATFSFTPPASACANWSLRISNALSDSTGVLLEPGAGISYVGSQPPPAPTLNAFLRSTNGASVTLSGQIPVVPGFATAAQVKVAGPSQVVTSPATTNFSLNVPLQPNWVNVLYVSAISPCGIEGAPITAIVTQDDQAPTLSIQYPTDGAQLTIATTDVTGTVGDMLSGFAGLTVTVNGDPASVDIGQGTTGTFFLQGVSLMPPGQPTSIIAVATDTLGNVASESITITQQALSPKVPFIEVFSGNAQSGFVHTFLQQPIRVKVWQGDGAPWANKLVSFRVTHNDGTLSEFAGDSGYGSGTQTFKILTSSSGIARARWFIGGSAGVGANRVDVTASDVTGTAVFCATGMAGAATQINVGSGNNQRVEVGAVAPLPLSAWANDSCNPGANVLVTFTVIAGDGLVNGESEVTVASDATGHAIVNFAAGPAPGINLVHADSATNTTNPAVFTIYGIERDPMQPTTFRGLVLDNASRPIGHAKALLQFQNTFTPIVFTDAQGQFEITGFTQSGAARLHIDATQANQLGGAPLPPGVSFTSLAYDATVIPNVANELGTPVLLPPLLSTNAVQWNGLSDVELTCDGIAGLKFFVKAGSMRLANGTLVNGQTVTLSINQVHHDDIPMPIPNGAAPAFAWTFQPGGATFDPPVEVEYPNMSALPPGAIAYFLTFNHATGAFEIFASGTVSADGSLIRTDPGTGLALSGWGCNCPPYAVTGDCEKCGVRITSGGEQTVATCANVTFTASGGPTPGSMSWSAPGGTPSTGSGSTFTTRYSAAQASNTVTARWTVASTGEECTDSTTVASGGKCCDPTVISSLSIIEVPLSTPCGACGSACGCTEEPIAGSQVVQIHACPTADCTMVAFRVVATREMESDPCPSNFTEVSGGGDPNITAANFCAMVDGFWSGGSAGGCFNLGGTDYDHAACVELHESAHFDEYIPLLQAQLAPLLAKPSMAPMPLGGPILSCAQAIEARRAAITADVSAAYAQATVNWDALGRGVNGYNAEHGCLTDLVKSICLWAQNDPAIDVDTCATCSSGTLGTVYTDP